MSSSVCSSVNGLSVVCMTTSQNPNKMKTTTEKFIHIRIPEYLHRLLKKKTVADKRSMSSVITEALRKMLTSKL